MPSLELPRQPSSLELERTAMLETVIEGHLLFRSHLWKPRNDPYGGERPWIGTLLTEDNPPELQAYLICRTSTTQSTAVDEPSEYFIQTGMPLDSSLKRAWHWASAMSPQEKAASMPTDDVSFGELMRLLCGPERSPDLLGLTIRVRRIKGILCLIEQPRE